MVVLPLLGQDDKVELDLVYKAIETASSNKCTDEVTGVAWAYFAVYFTVFIILCGHQFWNYKIEAQGNTATQGSMLTQRMLLFTYIWICSSANLLFAILQKIDNVLVCQQLPLHFLSSFHFFLLLLTCSSSYPYTGSYHSPCTPKALFMQGLRV